MKLTDNTIQRLNLEPIEKDLVNCWAYKVKDSGVGNEGVYIYNHSTLDYEPFPNNTCRVYQIKMIPKDGYNFAFKYAKYFTATIEFINDADLITIFELLEHKTWPQL